MFKSANYPKGFVAIYGSSRIKEENDKGAPDVIAANNKLYQEIRTFARLWTERFGSEYPIMTGAGPGLMQAGSRGAIEAGQSIGYTTYYFPNPTPDATHPYSSDPKLVFRKYKGQEIISEGLIFSSVATRETMMIMHSAAIIITPGGIGTEWETFQIFETIKSKQLALVPIFIVGDRKLYWQSLEARLGDLVYHTTLNDGEVTNFIEFVDKAEDVIERLRTRLGLK